METMNVVEARRNFSEVMARVAYQRQRVVVERKGRPMMALISVEDLRRLEALDRDAGDARTRRAPRWLQRLPRAQPSAPSGAASPCPTPAKPWPNSGRSAPMSRQICVDASFVLKLVFDEADSERVQALWAAWLAESATLIAPCHLACEVTAVIRNQVSRHNISAEAGQMAFEAFLAQEIELRHPGDLEARAWELAAQYNRPTAYDASYLALAESAGCDLWTADGRLVKAVAGTLPWVRTLHE